LTLKAKSLTAVGTREHNRRAKTKMRDVGFSSVLPQAFNASSVPIKLPNSFVPVNLLVYNLPGQSNPAERKTLLGRVRV
jgi:hypothetical protein